MTDHPSFLDDTKDVDVERRLYDLYRMAFISAEQPTVKTAPKRPIRTSAFKVNDTGVARAMTP